MTRFSISYFYDFKLDHNMDQPGPETQVSLGVLRLLVGLVEALPQKSVIKLGGGQYHLR
ncbi:MAG TPA: hypothetical protein VIW74_07335 [Pyrinomonadaceae bacterium]